jgi:hypothetical protein
MAGAAAEGRQTQPAPPGPRDPERKDAPLTVVLAGEDEDTAYAEPHIRRGID